jgi:hypothetical protein
MLHNDTAPFFRIFIYIEKNQLDNFASELCREAELSGNVGMQTSERAQELEEEAGLMPSISWSQCYSENRVSLSGLLHASCSPALCSL